MRTVALFVDAGYLFSAGTATVHGRVLRRQQVELKNVPTLLGTLVRRVAECCDGEALRVLRTYWYDGAPGGVPTPEQIEVGDLPRVKLRLGRVTAGGQKGVDGLIILDLITLARNRAADIAVLVTGDEDLREAAVHAQGYGITLVVAGFEPSRGQRQSALLLREADHVVKLGKADVAQHLPRSSGDHLDVPTPSTEHPAPAVSETEQSDADRSLIDLCRGVVEDERFASIPAVDHRSGQPRVSRHADKVLVARLAELTGQFPVPPEILERARKICVELKMPSI